MKFKNSIAKEEYGKIPQTVALSHEGWVGENTTIISVMNPTYDHEAYSILSESVEDERTYTRLLRFFKLYNNWEVSVDYERIE